MLLSPSLLTRLERLALLTRERGVGGYPGMHRSRRLGSSVDFADWRPYTAGDDFRKVDHHAYARLDRLLIRLYEAEDEATLNLVVDASASMNYEGKYESALRLAAAVAYVAALRGDRARAWLASGSGLRASPWARSRSSAFALFTWLEASAPSGSADLAAALTQVAAGRGYGGVTVLVGDLLTEQWEATLRRVAGPAVDGGVLHVLAASELNPTQRGDLLLVDSETGSKLDVSLSDQVLRDYRRRTEAWLARVRETCRRRNLRYALVTPDDDLESLLLVRLREEGVLS